MPFAGDALEAAEAVAALMRLERRPDDELILADNSGTAPASDGVAVVVATDERSPAHARNAGAGTATRDWILFLDADCRPRRELLDQYFCEPVPESVGALAGEVLPLAARRSRRPRRVPLAARYGATKGFLSQRQHLAHPYRPRAVAANLLVRRAAFVQVGGFYEGLRAAEDTDFAWRLQQAGWRLELRPEAWVEHRYRATLRELRHQWRGYAAGRAWLARRYDGFVPEPALSRAFGRLRRGPGRRAPTPRPSEGRGRLERGRYLALDALLAFEELAGFALSNRPARVDCGSAADTSVIFVADRFPSPDDPLIELPSALRGEARIEAARRPQVMPPDARQLRIRYREDDGLAERLLAAASLLLAHPLRCLRDLGCRRKGDPSLLALSPAVRRLRRAPAARVQPLGGDGAADVADRLKALAGRRER